MTTLADALRELARARVAEDGARRLVAALEVALASTPEGVALAKVREELSQKQKTLKTADEAVREEQALAEKESSQ